MTSLVAKTATHTLFHPYGGTADTSVRKPKPRVLLSFGRQPLLHQTPVVRIVRCLDDVCPRYRRPRSSKLHFHHWSRRLSVGPRFECLQTKRCALLWSVSYPCSIFHTLVSRFTTPRSQVKFKTLSLPQSSILRYFSARLLHRPLAVPPPLFARSSTRVDARLGPSYLRKLTALTVSTVVNPTTTPFLDYQWALGYSFV